MRLAIIALILAIAFPALAESPPASVRVPERTLRSPEPKLKFQKKKLWNFAAIPAYFMLETTLHEGSHGIGGVIAGGKWVSFKPYPHIQDGYFLWGSSTVYGNFSRAGEAFFDVAPYITDVVLFTSTDLFLGYGVVNPNSVGGLILYSAGMLAPWVNFVYNVNSQRSTSDFALFSANAGLNHWAVLAVGDIVAAAALWRLIVRGRDVLFSPVVEKSNRVTVIPLAGSVKGASLGVSF